MQLVADRFLRLPGGQTLDLASGEEVVLSISSVGSMPEHVSWAERCAECVASESGALIDYGRIGRALRFEATLNPSPHRLRQGDGGPPELHAKADGLGYRSVRRYRSSGRAAEDPAKYAHHDRSWDAILRRIVERLDYGDRVSWESAVVRIEIAEVTRLTRAIAREARLRGYVPLGVGACTRWPQLLDRIKGSHVLLVAQTPPRAATDRMVMTRALITLGLASPRPHLLVFVTPETGAPSSSVRHTWTARESSEPYVVTGEGSDESERRQRPRLTPTPRASPGFLSACGAPGLRSSTEGASFGQARRSAEGAEAAPPLAAASLLRPSTSSGRAEPVEARARQQPQAPGERGVNGEREAEIVDDHGPSVLSDSLGSIDERWPAIRAMAERGMRFAGAGRLAPAERLLRESMRAMARRGVPLAAASMGLELARVLMDAGRTGDAVRVYQEARGWFDARSAIGMIEAAIGIGTAWTEEGRLAEAEAALQSAALAAEHIEAGSARVRALAGVAGIRLWQNRPREALTIVDAARPTDPALRSRADRLSARAWLALGDLVRAGRLVAAALEEAEASGDVRDLAATHAVALGVQAAIGNTSGVKHHAAQGLMSARRAHWRLGALRIRVSLLESYNVLRRIREARTIAARFRRRPLHNVPLLLRVRLQMALTSASPEHPAARGSRREWERLVRVNGVRALDRASQEKPSMDVIQDVIEVMRICHEAEDERLALDRICLTVRERSRALSVGLFANEPEGAPLSFAGSAPRSCPLVAQRAMETGLAIPPAHYGDAVEAAAPVRYGGQTVAALASRWSGEVPIGAERAAALLAAAAAASAPGVRATLDRRTTGTANVEAEDELIGRSDVMEQLRKAMTRAAAAPFCVLIEGESGSGKELVARAIHRLSRRRSHRFCALNCAALTDELVEAELFGYARGAFTGASVERAGLFEEAEGGTMLLDEVGELSPRAQAKLLRAVQEGEVRRIGENFSRRVDVRIVAATNRALREEVATGRFRSDLLYRLDVVRIVVPPLRDRVEDIPLLAVRFWTRALEHTGSRATLDPATLAALARYDWPGNVREVENVMAMLAVNAPRRGRVSPGSLPAAIAGAAPSSGGTLEQARQQFERRFVRAALARAGGHRGRTARELGVSRQGLAKLMARLGVGEGCGPVKPDAISRTSR